MLICGEIRCALVSLLLSVVRTLGDLQLICWTVDTVTCRPIMCVQQVTLAALANADVNDFRKEVARRMLLPPWDSYINNNINVS